MMPLKPPSGRSSNPRQLRHQLLVFRHPMFWGTTIVLLLSGWFLLEYWQPQTALNRSENAAPRPNPLRYGSSSNAGNDTGGLPPMPSVLPPAANAPLPIDPTAPASGSPQDKAQPNARPSQSASSGSGTADLSSTDLYNPAGISLPRAWETPSTSAAPSASERPIAPAASNAPSPLQAALDRMHAPQVPTVLPQSGEASDSSGAIGTQSAGSGIGSSSTDGTIGGMPGSAGSGLSDAGQTLPQSSPSMPQSTGYTMPPAFRTTTNTPSFYGSPTTSPNSATPDTPTTLPLNPAPLPQSNSRSSMGNGEINTFSNP